MNILFIIKVKIHVLIIKWLYKSNYMFHVLPRNGCKERSIQIPHAYLMCSWIEDAFATKGSHGDDHINYE